MTHNQSISGYGVLIYCQQLQEDLREYMATHPDPDLKRLAEAAYLITDKSKVLHGGFRASDSDAENLCSPWERAGFQVVKWSPTVGDRVSFIHEGGHGTISEIVPSGIRVDFDDGDRALIDPSQVDPIEVMELNGNLEE